MVTAAIIRFAIWSGAITIMFVFVADVNRAAPSMPPEPDGSIKQS
jgi:hypothetical protein